MPRKKAEYNEDSIIKMEDIDHIRHNSGMYVGDTDDATRLAEEVLDNSLDEVQAGFCNIIGVFVDTKEKTFRVLDNGRGIPFNPKKEIEEDTPVIICTKLFTSGKFNKKNDDSAYTISSGLHGVGMSCVYALSDYVKIEIYRDNKHATFDFNKDGSIHRNIEKHTTKTPFSTKIEVKPCKKYFDNTNINLKKIENRLKIASANFPELKIVYKVDEEQKVFNTTEMDLVKENISSTEEMNWITLESFKDPESCRIIFGWDPHPPMTMKSYTTVNLCEVASGSHINLFTKMLKEFMLKEAGKRKLSFEPNDSLTSLRLYINLKIVNTAFTEQVKDRLASRTDLSVMDDIEKELSNYFKKNEDQLVELLESFQAFRQSQTNKKLIGTETTVKRGFTKLMKLKDCTGSNGELIIGEGDSAIGGLSKQRDKTKHAILALRGVPPNAVTKKSLFENPEVKEIIQACGCGIGANCDVSKLRYNKIILAADADPAGKHICSLLIIMFAVCMPEVIKSGKLFVCHTPLYGTRRKGEFVPLWTDDAVQKALNKKEHVTRFKGLGEFNPSDLKVFTLDEKTRKLEQVEWDENYEKLFELFSDPKQKFKLLYDEWEM